MVNFGEKSTLKQRIRLSPTEMGLSQIEGYDFIQ